MASIDNDNEGGEVLQVFVRVRPPISKEIKIQNAVTVTGNHLINLKSEKYDISCKYNKVFNEICDQETVFNSIKPLIINVLHGFNACIFAYGQTSAGKSHTMIGMYVPIDIHQLLNIFSCFSFFFEFLPIGCTVNE